MNITRTATPRVSPQKAAQKPCSCSEKSTSKFPKANDGFSYSDGVTSAASYTSAIAGGLKGVAFGWSKGIDLAVVLGIQEAGLLLSATSIAGGAVGALSGFHGTKFAADIGGKAAKALGVSENVGQAVGATAVGAAFGGAFTGSATGAAVGAGISLGAGGLVYASNR